MCFQFFMKDVYSFRRFNRNRELILNCWRSHRISTFTNIHPSPLVVFQEYETDDETDAPPINLRPITCGVAKVATVTWSLRHCYSVTVLSCSFVTAGIAFTRHCYFVHSLLSQRLTCRSTAFKDSYHNGY